MADDKKNAVHCYVDATGSAYSSKIKEFMESRSSEYFTNVTVGNVEQWEVPTDHIPILAVHRTDVWEKTADKNLNKAALERYCKKDDKRTLLIVFTGGWDKYPGHEEWWKIHVQGACSDFPPERFCALLDREFVRVFSDIVEYLEKTPLDHWRVEDFWQHYTPRPYLSALSILSQGYLAVCAGELDTGLKAEALKQLTMNEEMCTRLADKKRMVKEKGFWDVFNGEPAGGIETTASAEWRKIPLNLEFERVEKLIKHVYGPQANADAETVYGAYNDLVKKLGTAR